MGGWPLASPALPVLDGLDRASRPIFPGLDARSAFRCKPEGRLATHPGGTAGGTAVGRDMSVGWRERMQFEVVLQELKGAFPVPDVVYCCTADLNFGAFIFMT